jgi:hypothetical protein
LDTLENYLASDYLAEKQEIEAIDRTLNDVAATFSAPEIFDGKMWPYEFRTDGSRPTPSAGTVSQGTLAMVLTATGRMLGHCKLPKGTFAKPDVDDAANLESNWTKGLKVLLADLVKSGHKPKVRSRTFGDDNPLTLSHLSELYSLLHESDYSTQRDKLYGGIAEARKVLKKTLANLTMNKELLEPHDKSERYYSNAFVPVRAIRAASDLSLGILGERHQRFFESTLHDHLSFSAIPDSRFDAAELVFCLEGLLLCAPEAVDAALFNRVLQVLAEKQNTSAHWRPNKPFVASSTGSIMLPLSVEVANSLMRSVVLMDANRPYDTFTAKSLPLIQRFWHWLRARALLFDLGGRHCIGWHSEHVNEPNLIHIWDTSQVIEFMIAFREMLERHLASKSLQLSRLDIKRLRPKKNDANKKARKRWAKKIARYEPSLGTTAGGKVYKLLLNDFIIPWENGHPINYSMLLYGPPGTGKTVLAENIAEVLEMPLITVTVSDFLGTGGENVEARAKAIFQTLEAQDKCVILFDEIDSFLLHRDTKLYREQDSLFKFLTPGMLTKINDLRRRMRSIFIIATNYADRIDPAIKRKGRVDKQYLLPLPDAQRRLKIMKSFGLKLPAKTAALKRRTAFFGFTDLKGAMLGAGGKNATKKKIIDILEQSEPATSFDSYLARLNSDEQFPLREFLGLVAIAQEVGGDSEIKKAIDDAKRDTDKEKLLKRYKLLKFGSGND